MPAADDVGEDTVPGVGIRFEAVGDPLVAPVTTVAVGDPTFTVPLPTDFRCSAAAALWTAAAAITFFSGWGAFGMGTY